MLYRPKAELAADLLVPTPTLLVRFLCVCRWRTCSGYSDSRTGLGFGAGVAAVAIYHFHTALGAVLEGRVPYLQDQPTK